MIHILYVAVGGALGSLMRYLASQFINEMHTSYIPWGTFCINLVGALFIGIFFVLISEKQLIDANLRYFLIIGILGGFTTFSSFSLESFQLIEAGHILAASFYMLGSTLLCLLGVWLGVYITRSFF